MTIAKWDGVSAYGYSGSGTQYALAKSALFCTPNCSFTTVGGTNVVKMLAEGVTGTVIRSNLMFHKVQNTGEFRTDLGASRDNEITSGYTNGASVCDPSYYNVPLLSTNPNFQNFKVFYGF